jgi:hypothetical protein
MQDTKGTAITGSTTGRQMKEQMPPNYKDGHYSTKK